MIYEKNTIYIDPGVNGGIAWVNNEGVVCASRCPEKRYTLILDLLKYIKTNELKGSVKTLYIEKQGARPTDTAKNAMTLGMNYAFWLMSAHGLKIPVINVQPKAWQKKIGFKLPFEYTDKKKRLAEFARSVFPEIDVLRFDKDDNIKKISGKVTNANADALCMVYCIRNGI